MNSKLKNLFRGIILISLLIGTYFLLDRIFLIKSKDGITQLQAYYKQEENSIDVLFIGNSHTFCHINTGILWDKYGITGFNLGGAEQPYWNTYYYLKEALKTQHPKLIAFEFTAPGIHQVEIQPENWMVTNNYGFKRNKNRYDSIKASALKESFERLLFPLSTMHSRYQDLSENDFTNRFNSISYKGFDPRDTYVPFEAPDITAVMDRSPLLEKEEKYMRMIIELVQSENIPLLLFSSPYVVTEESQKIYNTVFDIALEYGVGFLDFNRFYSEIGLDFQTDMAEELHLNRMGNAKFTLYLGSFIQDFYKIPDHREEGRSKESIYYSWNEDELFNRHDNAAYYIRNIYNPDKYFTLFLDTTEPEDNEYLHNYDPDTDEEINDDPIYEDGLIEYFMPDKNRYLVFIQLPTDMSSISFELSERLKALGVDNIYPGAAYAVCNGELIFSSYMNSFSHTTDDGRKRITFTRTPWENDMPVTIASESPNYDTVVRILNQESHLRNSDTAFIVYDTVSNRIVDNITIKSDSESYYIEHNNLYD